MSWHYRVRKRTINGEPWYDIVEMYRIKGQRAWSKDGEAPGSDTRKGIIDVLEMMLRDAKRYKAFTDNEVAS